MSIFPSVGNSKPAIIRRDVVLPQPDGPNREKNSPSLICIVTWLTAARIPPSGVANFLTTSCISTANSFGISLLLRTGCSYFIQVSYHYKDCVRLQNTRPAACKDIIVILIQHLLHQPDGSSLHRSLPV